MPLYEYRCAKCKDVFEELVKGNPESVPCPKCGSAKTERLLSRCRSKMNKFGPGFGDDPRYSGPTGGGPKTGGGCSSCSGGDCSSCG